MHITRIVTHTDFDGLISALLLQEILGVEEVVFAEPWMISDNTFTVHKTDAVVDLPYPANGCGLWIDHHASNPGPQEYHDATKKSCPSLIYEKLKVDGKYLPLIIAADKIDSASYTEQDIRHPDAAMQIAISLDTHRRIDDSYRTFLLDQLRNYPLADVAKLHLVQQRYEHVMRQQEEFLAKAQDDIIMRGNVVLLDATKHDVPPCPLLPFLLYLEYPRSCVSIILTDAGARVRANIGENIFSRLNNVDIGKLLREYGGGGHKGAGGCSIPVAQKEEIIDRLVAIFNQ